MSKLVEEKYDKSILSVYYFEQNTARRERNEDLCASNRRSVELNSEQWEFDPPFLVEIRCRNVHDYEVGAKGTIEDQVRPG